MSLECSVSFRTPEKYLVEVHGIIGRKLTKAEALDALERLLRQEGRHVGPPPPPGGSDKLRAYQELEAQRREMLRIGDLQLDTTSPLPPGRIIPARNLERVIKGELLDDGRFDRFNKRFMELHPEREGQDCFALTDIEQGTRNFILRELYRIPVGWRIDIRASASFEARPVPAGEITCCHGMRLGEERCYECERDKYLMEQSEREGIKITPGKHCPHCGMTFEWLRAQGAAGCRRIEDTTKWLAAVEITHHCALEGVAQAYVCGPPGGAEVGGEPVHAPAANAALAHPAIKRDGGERPATSGCQCGAAATREPHAHYCPLYTP
jgi:hypothetical protein